MKTLWKFDMAYPHENNIETKRLEKRTNYRKITFRRAKFKDKVVPLVINTFFGDIKEILTELEKNVWKR